MDCSSEQANIDRSTDGSNGRDSAGRFTKGNPGGPGSSPYARRVLKFRNALLRAITSDDIRDIAIALIAEAKSGDVQSARLILGYAVGKPPEIGDGAGESVTIIFRRPSDTDGDPGDTLEQPT